MIRNQRNSRFFCVRISKIATCVIGAVVIGAFWCSANAQQAAGQETFPSASAACRALVTALQENNGSILLRILGSDAKGILYSGDAVEDRENREEFVAKYQQMHRLVREPDGTTTLYVGAENWPTPIPLVEKHGAWYFDTPAGTQEILHRRIGRNKLAVIQVCHELVDAEKEYYAEPHDGDSGREYAQKLYSDPNKHDGLYWEAGSGEPESPIGPFVAAAATEGYANEPGRKSEPFHGYYFRVLKGQGANEPGGARSYIVEGRMTGGFGFVAYPADYRSSGVMTFIVDQDGLVYQKDLGPRTAQLAKSLTRYDRNATWQKD